MGLVVPPSDAAPEVKAAIQRYNSFNSMFRDNLPALWFLLGDTGTYPYKLSAEASLYTDYTEVRGQACASCQYAYAHLASEKYVCSVISPLIVPGGWCKFWSQGTHHARP